MQEDAPPTPAQQDKTMFKVGKSDGKKGKYQKKNYRSHLSKGEETRGRRKVAE